MTPEELICDLSEFYGYEVDLSYAINYIDMVGEAGAMMIEGFNKKYIVSQKGNTSTAMGLNAEILKAYI